MSSDSFPVDRLRTSTHITRPPGLSINLTLKLRMRVPCSRTSTPHFTTPLTRLRNRKFRSVKHSGLPLSSPQIKPPLLLTTLTRPLLPSPPLLLSNPLLTGSATKTNSAKSITPTIKLTTTEKPKSNFLFQKKTNGVANNPPMMTKTATSHEALRRHQVMN